MSVKPKGYERHTYDEMNRWSLAVVNSRMIIEAMSSVRDTRDGILLGETQHRIYVLLLLWVRQLSLERNSCQSYRETITSRSAMSHPFKSLRWVCA